MRIAASSGLEIASAVHCLQAPPIIYPDGNDK
jgi:hypothetical protein